MRHPLDVVRVGAWNNLIPIPESELKLQAVELGIAELELTPTLFVGVQFYSGGPFNLSVNKHD